MCGCAFTIFMLSTFTYHSYVHFDEMDGLGLLHHTRFLIHLERAQQKSFLSTCLALVISMPNEMRIYMSSSTV